MKRKQKFSIDLVVLQVSARRLLRCPDVTWRLGCSDLFLHYFILYMSKILKLVSRGANIFSRSSILDPCVNGNACKETAENQRWVCITKTLSASVFSQFSRQKTFLNKEKTNQTLNLSVSGTLRNTKPILIR